MILLWFFVGIFIIFAIARYNESNKLFWTFLLFYVMGFAGAKMMYDITSSDKQSNKNLTQVYSTQVSPNTLDATMCFITKCNSDTKNVVTAHESVSQGISPAPSEMNVILSEIFGRTRDQPCKLIKPPELQKNFFNTS